MIRVFAGEEPRFLGSEIYVAPSAEVIGKVSLSNKVIILFGAVLRGDIEVITVGEGSNVQDGAVIHTSYQLPVTLGANVSIGHGAIIHACRIGDETLIGMNAVVLDGAEVGRCCLVGANALVPVGTKIPDGSLFLGSPGRVVAPLSEHHRQNILKGAKHYQEKIREYRTLLTLSGETSKSGA